MKYFIIAMLINSSASAATMQLKFLNDDIKIIGEFSYHAKHPLTINGFDKNDKPFSLVINARPQTNDSLELHYELQRNGKKNTGSVMSQKGKLASLATKTEKQKQSDVVFEAIVTE